MPGGVTLFQAGAYLCFGALAVAVVVATVAATLRDTVASDSNGRRGRARAVGFCAPVGGGLFAPAVESPLP